MQTAKERERRYRFCGFLAFGDLPPRRYREEPTESCVVRGITPPSGAHVADPREVNTCSRAQKSALAVRKKLFGDLPPPFANRASDLRPDDDPIYG